jgi:hypothetical protein
MEYNEKNTPLELNMTVVGLANITERLNDAYRAIADLRSALEGIEVRLDEAEHMTSEEYGNQVVKQVMEAMPAIQAAAMKQTKRGGRR